MLHFADMPPIGTGQVSKTLLGEVLTIAIPARVISCSVFPGKCFSKNAS